MSEQQPLHPQKINKSQNDKIVQLIKSKLTPMHKKNKIFPRLFDQVDINAKQNNRHTLGEYKTKDIPICEKHISYDREINKQIRTVPLIKKVKSHIEEKKKVISQQEIQNAKLKMPKISLGSYIQLFSRPQEVYLSKSTLEFSKFKRQSLALNVFDNIENLLMKQSQKGLTEDDICLMNAKFRKQLNHRKLIGIWKIRNRI